MLHVICTRLRPGNLSVRVGDSSRRCEGIVKKSRIAPLNAIIIIIIMMTIMGAIIMIKDDEDNDENDNDDNGYNDNTAVLLSLT